MTRLLKEPGKKAVFVAKRLLKFFCFDYLLLLFATLSLTLCKSYSLSKSTFSSTGSKRVILSRQDELR